MGLDLKDLLLLLGISQLAAIATVRSGISALGVYLLVGMLLGPHGLGLVNGYVEGSLVSLAMLFLVFYAGLNVDFKSLKNHVLEAALATSLGVALTMAFTYASSRYLGLDVVPSLVVGVSLSNTATEVAVLLMDRLGSYGGLKDVIVSASFMDDLIIVFVTSLTEVLVVNDVLTPAFNVVKQALVLGLPLLTAYVAVRLSEGYVRIFSWEEFVITLSSAFFLLSYLSMALGVNEVLGAYVAGLVFSMFKLLRDPTLRYVTRFNEFMEDAATVLKFFVVPIFFVSVGLHVDFTSVDLKFFAVLLTSAFLGKFLGSLAYVAVEGGLRSLREGVLMGLAMNVRGSLEPALAITAFNVGLIDSRVLTAVLLISMTSSLVIPFALSLLSRFFRGG